MHVLPLPFGMALALVPRHAAQYLSRPKAPWSAQASVSRERILTETRYAEFRQRIA